MESTYRASISSICWTLLDVVFPSCVRIKRLYDGGLIGTYISSLSKSRYRDEADILVFSEGNVMDDGSA